MGRDSNIEAARQRMLDLIAVEARATACYTGRAVFSQSVMDAMAKVPRHEFVESPDEHLAYVNAALPVGHGQTISQPYIVALMTDLLDLNESSAVLEVGTGTGYQAAVLAEIVASVYTVEILPELAESAATRLRRLGYRNVHVQRGDGYHGWREHAPYDGILVAAAAQSVPPPLLEQLKPGGRLIIPIGLPFTGQELMVVEKKSADKTHMWPALRVAFVPFTRDHLRPASRQ